MSEYHYGMPNDTGEKKKKNDNDWFSWVLIVFLFSAGIWPIALFLLFMKLSDDGKKKPVQTQRKTAQSTAGKTAASQTERARAAAKKVTKAPEIKSSNAKWMKVAGAVLMVLGVICITDPIGALFWSNNWLAHWLGEFLQYAAMVAGGLGLFLHGKRMERRIKRYQKYQAVIGQKDAMPMAQLSRTLGYPVKSVTDDLQRMIDKGYFGGQAYLNMELGYFFRNAQADAELARQKAEQAAARQTPKEAEEGYSGILRNIRRANDRIADEALSAKIDRLEEIAAKIFRAVEENPSKQSRINNFFNYYLPTTQKLLDAYAEFEAAGIEGENLRQAKRRIEDTMDKVVAGFEHQLDELYRSDAMDVDKDIRVMETMLGRDTASVERDFGLGKAARGGAKVKETDLGGMAAQQMEE